MFSTKRCELWGSQSAVGLLSCLHEGRMNKFNFVICLTGLNSLSSSYPHSEPTQVTMLYSRQGTTETIEEVEGEHEEEGAHSASRQDEEEVEDYSLGSEGAMLTPDTDVPLYSTVDSNAEAPPSYSKAVSFEHLPFGSPDDSAGKSLMMVSPDDSRTDRLNDTILPPLTHELTASELLLHK